MSPTDRKAGSWWASRSAWVLLAAVAAAFLAYGAVGGGGASGNRRADALDAVIKCPACEDLSIAQSDAPSSVTLRHEVARFVKKGWSNERIESWVTARYGAGSLLVPEGKGENAALYVVPVAAVGVAVGALGWYLWRRRSATSVAKPS